MKYQIGELVRLKAGGPTMRVEVIEGEIGDERATCHWDDDTGSHRATIDTDLLESVDPAYVADFLS